MCPTLSSSWTVTHQAPLSMGFLRQEYWSGLPFPPPRDLPDPGSAPVSPVSLALAGGFLTTEPFGKPLLFFMHNNTYFNNIITIVIDKGNEKSFNATIGGKDPEPSVNAGRRVGPGAPLSSVSSLISWDGGSLGSPLPLRAAYGPCNGASLGRKVRLSVSGAAERVGL